MWTKTIHQLPFFNKRVLSIGPRDGQYERQYVTQADALTVLEPEPDSIASFEAQWDAALRPTFICDTLQNVALPANSFDIILLHRSY